MTKLTALELDTMHRRTLKGIPFNSLWTHNATGVTYRIIFVAYNVSDLEPTLVYQRVLTADELPTDRALLRPMFVRSLSEFMDGRFTEIPTTEITPINTSTE